MVRRRLLPVAGWLLFCLLFAAAPEALAAAPRVVVSIKPLAGLAAAVMAGVGQPQLLLPGGSSPHSFALRPSQMRALHHADLIVWIGPELESFLAKSLRDPNLRTKTLQLTKLPGINLLPARKGGSWGEDPDEEHRHGGIDPHLWLDPANARQLLNALSARLIQLDPRHAARYRANAAAEKRKISALQHRLKQQLVPLRQSPYLVFHDAYQYFEQAFGLHPLGALAIHPEQAPGARRIREMRRQIKNRNVRCVFSEPQFEPRLVATLIEGTGARHGELDPIGAALPDGPDSYLDLLQGMADNLQACLGQ